MAQWTAPGWQTGAGPVAWEPCSPGVQPLGPAFCLYSWLLGCRLISGILSGPVSAELCKSCCFSFV